jgi:hypothetical protein
MPIANVVTFNTDALWCEVYKTVVLYYNTISRIQVRVIPFGRTLIVGYDRNKHPQ